MDFAHLHLHTHYSLRDSLILVEELAEKAKECGYSSVGITDHGHISGWIEFYSVLKDRGLNPVLGVEAYFLHSEEKETERRHLTLLAQNNEGYSSLIKLMSLAGTEGFHYVPRVDFSMLKKHSAGVICLTGCSYRGIFGEGLTLKESLTLCQKLREIFGERLFFEVMPHQFEMQRRANARAVLCSRIFGNPIVLTYDVHYLEKEDSIVHDVLMDIQGRERYEAKTFWYKSPEEVEQDVSRSSLLRRAALNSYRLARSCSVELKFGEFKFPKFEVPEDEEFERWVRAKRRSI